MKKTLQRGFTLIELLVVIAIIGILAAVVLASLNDARDGGQDASIKQSIGNARSQAELIYNTAGANQYSYTDVCNGLATNQVTTLVVAAQNNRSETTAALYNAGIATAQTSINVKCASNASGYAISAPLNVPVGTDPAYWCVDSTGRAVQTITPLGANLVVCP